MALKNWIDNIKKGEGDKASEAILKPGKTEEDRTKLLEAIADEILFTARDTIVESGVFYVSPALRIVENEVNEAYKNIITGAGTLTPLIDACGRWKTAAGHSNQLAPGKI
jgi:hypothetical protein